MAEETRTWDGVLTRELTAWLGLAFVSYFADGAKLEIIDTDRHWHTLNKGAVITKIGDHLIRVEDSIVWRGKMNLEAELWLANSFASWSVNRSTIKIRQKVNSVQQLLVVERGYTLIKRNGEISVAQ